MITASGDAADRPTPCPDETHRASPVITPFLLASLILIWVSFAVGWLRGGHAERFAVAALFCDYALTRLTTGMAGAHELVAVSEFVLAVIFTCMAFRSERWWTLVASGALTLCVLVFVLEWTNPDLSRNAAISARSGLWFVIPLSLLAGVAERWLAGERAVSDAAVWRRRPAPRGVGVAPGEKTL